MVLRGEITKCSWLQNMVTKIVSCETRNQQQTSQTTDKPVKPPTNHPKTSQTTHKPAKFRTNHPKTSQLWAENQFFMLPKTLITMQNMS